MKKIKEKYYTVHINDGDDGYSVFFKASFPKKPNMDDILSYAADSGNIDIDDIRYADEATEITKKQYDRTTN
jgi:hypothetical protein